MRPSRVLAPVDVPEPGSGSHPVAELMLSRMAEGSRRGARRDGAVIALAIEGGGRHGAVSAGMCVLMEKAGLIDAIDAIYGSSSGALNGSFTASGQAALGSTNYVDTANMRFANPMRMLRGRPVMDFDMLFGELIRDRKPYDPAGLACGPGFGALAVDLTTSELRVLDDFVDTDELVDAVRVSCAIPVLSGPPPSFRGTPMADGALIEAIPYASAMREGATHVLVLRSRPAAYRKSRFAQAIVELVRREAHPAVAPLMLAWPGRYNAQAEHLQRIGAAEPRLLQIAPPSDAPRIGQIEHSYRTIHERFLAGANAAASAFGLGQVEMFWQPEIYAVSDA